ncbi:hypothetical protein HPB47_001880 [Ixodes persulcatus]|uniref:Uncharacterized protein n=1 Tax=Ixodes persulcatus TaxID=34615 RepID=A0AC60PN01_IXOPE|nr:hypothetical protein HPB47_001880 [Ixodes persulcatus]
MVPENKPQELHAVGACTTLRGYANMRPGNSAMSKEATSFTAEGILTELFSSLKAKVATMIPVERHAALMINEMQITPGKDYDSSLKKVIGKITVPLAPGSVSADECATHTFVFMLGGMTSRWKQTVAYEFTGTSSCSAKVKDLTFDLIRKCESIGLSIVAIITDMGPGNQGLWRECGITATKLGKTCVSCEHPCASGSDR